ncbi:MAG TPA: hypothetical protein VGI81_10445 [Tepidisphaeraceae bacterium]|jgi:hypothetical protein
MPPTLLGPIYSIDFLLLLACAVGFYKLADLDPEASPIVWACLSAGVFFVTWRLLRWGLPGDLFGQIALIGGITAVRILRSRRGPP